MRFYQLKECKSEQGGRSTCASSEAERGKIHRVQNTKNQGRVSECPKENEFWSGGQNCTTSEPENVREIFFSGT